MFHFVQWCHESNSFGDDDTDKLPRKQIKVIAISLTTVNTIIFLFIVIYQSIVLLYIDLHL